MLIYNLFCGFLYHYYFSISFTFKIRINLARVLMWSRFQIIVLGTMVDEIFNFFANDCDINYATQVNHIGNQTRDQAAFIPDMGMVIIGPSLHTRIANTELYGGFENYAMSVGGSKLMLIYRKVRIFPYSVLMTAEFMLTDCPVNGQLRNI